MTTETISHGMRILRDVPIPMSDGIVLRADVFLPTDGAPVPAVMSLGCYAKGIQFQEGYANQWRTMVDDFPEIEHSSSGDFQVWELTDPERWVPDGYGVVRVDSRGSGNSEGVRHLWGHQEIDDFVESIDWAAAQEWSDGKVGLLGISYYAANHWLVAARQPEALKAIIPWEGTSDWYRDYYFHGGIRCTFLDSWSANQARSQYGYGDRGIANNLTGETTAGPTMSADFLAANMVDVVADIKAHPLFDDRHEIDRVDWSKVTVPLLSSANWGGQGLHLRGNIEGFVRAASEQKWLEIHGLEHWTHFYTDYGVGLQREFFDHFLKGIDNGWDSRPPVLVNVRRVGGFELRGHGAWPLPETSWRELALDAGDLSLGGAVGTAAEVAYDTEGDGVRFLTEPIEAETEITGPLAAQLTISADTEDADLFLVLGLFDPNGDEVVFRGAMDAHTPVAQGWLRASHRALDQHTLPYRPHHRHTEREPLVPGERYQVEVEIWPTSIVVPPGYRLGLTVRGKDYEYAGVITPEARARHRYPSKGCGPFLHNDPEDRPTGGTVTVHTGAESPSTLLLPVIGETTLGRAVELA